MQRDQQGAAIAMGVFIVLTVVFIVTTCIFASKSNQFFQQFEAAQAAERDKDNALRSAQGEIDSLKQIIGYIPSTPLDAIQSTHKEHVDKFGATIPGGEEQKGYMHLMVNRDSALRDKITELAGVASALLDLQKNYDTITEKTNARIQISDNQSSQAQKSLQEETQRYTASESQNQEKIRNLTDERQKLESDARELAAEANTKVAYAEQRVDTIHDINQQLAAQLRHLQSPSLIKEDGRVLSVNQQTGAVFIDLGSSSGLQPGTTFAVFDPINRDMAVAESKGNIEVIQILGNRSAEARIQDTLLTDPILEGDLIYTPVWKPGQKPRFALCGKLTVAGMGSRQAESQITLENDLFDVMNLIVANGGEIDAYMDLKGNIEGAITQETTYLVVGTGEDLGPDAMKSLYKMQEDAKIHAVRTVTLPELLRQMGYKNTTPIRGFGLRATPSDLGPRPTKPLPSAPGRVSQLYDQRDTTMKVAEVNNGAVSEIRSQRPIPARVSPGTVSPLYQQNRLPVRPSNGNVSGIYGGR